MFCEFTSNLHGKNRNQTGADEIVGVWVESLASCGGRGKGSGPESSKLVKPPATIFSRS